VSSTDWARTTAFAKDVIDFVVQNSSQTQLALAVYATTVQPIFQMNTCVYQPACPPACQLCRSPPLLGHGRYTTVEEMTCAVDLATRKDDLTFTGKALSYTNLTMFTEANGMRPYGSATSKVGFASVKLLLELLALVFLTLFSVVVVQVVILVTDGIANDPTTAAAQAAVLKSMGVSIFVVAIAMPDAISAATQAQEIGQLASAPLDQHIFILRNISFIGEVFCSWCFTRYLTELTNRRSSTKCAGGRAWHPR
jgi:hypothetical protein